MAGHASSLRVRAGRAATIGVVAVSVAALAARAWLPLGALYPWKAGVAFAVIVTVAASGLALHPHPILGPANQITTVRAMLLALLVGLVGEPEASPITGIAVAVATAVALLDGLDGWLARRSGLASAFGARFDMEIDAVFVLVLSVLVWQDGRAGAWVLSGGVLRYAFVAAGWLLPWMARPLSPTWRAKTITACHMGGLIVALAPFIPAPLGTLTVAATLAALWWSFAVDVSRLWRGRGGFPEGVS